MYHTIQIFNLVTTLYFQVSTASAVSISDSSHNILSASPVSSFSLLTTCMCSEGYYGQTRAAGNNLAFQNQREKKGVLAIQNYRTKWSDR